jgi:hypothetical protein
LLFISPSIFKAVFLETIAGLMPLKKYLHRYPDPSPSPMVELLEKVACNLIESI